MGLNWEYSIPSNYPLMTALRVTAPSSLFAMGRTIHFGKSCIKKKKKTLLI